MFVLSTMPSSESPCAASSSKTRRSVASVTSAQRSMPWSPSISTSGSTMGTSPASCDSAAKRASACALTSMQ